ncbi:N-acetylmuramoyl-L-alanine amidase [Gallaecimonas sp. GXIMD4217]|uniref:N-acetylmuramoyl-L-alanine amidase n=1 Tax=Gallaecimonas sp. GXIMD4217 TaxID=3131927 RepID=UPI00311ADC07
MRSVLAVLVLLVTLPCWAANEVAGVRVWPSDASTRVVFDMDEAPEYSFFTLKKPDRLVIDFKDTARADELPLVVENSPLVTRIRTSNAPKAGATRVVVELKAAIKPVLFPLGPSDPYGHRLVVDIKPAAEQAEQVTKTVQASNRDIVIAVDAGHGGKDPGSIGPKGTQERHVTLAIAKRLANRINQVEGMKAVLIRSDDRFLEVEDRANLARKHQADMLVSIHADSVASPKPRGASVWVLNNSRARREIGKWIRKKEKHSELLGGAAEVIEDTKQEQYLAQALLDMSMDHSRSVGQDIGSQVLRELSKVTKLHKNRPQPNSLGVLTAPDIPSLLVETGFISNPSEEKLLASSRHQQRLADAMYKAIHDHFRAWPPQGTLFAATGNRIHVVRSGESLSLLASRYGTTVTAIKRANNLSGSVVRIGQKLTIPQS